VAFVAAAEAGRYFPLEIWSLRALALCARTLCEDASASASTMAREWFRTSTSFYRGSQELLRIWCQRRQCDLQVGRGIMLRLALLQHLALQ